MRGISSGHRRTSHSKHCKRKSLQLDKSSPPVAALIRLAEAAYALSDPGSWKEKWPPAVLGVITDPDRSQLMSLAANASREQLNDVVHVLSEVPDLSVFSSGGPFDPTLVYPGGSMRQPFSQFAVALLVSAAQRFYFFRQESTLDSFVDAVIENYENFIRQGRGEPIRAYDLVGYTGVELSPGSQIATPWGILRPAPSNFRVGLQFNRTTAVLAAPRTMTLKVSREEYPAQLSADDSVTPNISGARQLLPMAFALASRQNPRCAPMVTFEAVLLPLVELNSYQHPGILFPVQPTVRPNAQELKDTEAWAERLEESRAGTLQIAERRLVSAIAQRSEKVDALIDAVIAWESLVGTRRDKADKVPRALAILLKNEPSERSALFERLKEIYNLRTDVVHGHAVSDADVSSASSEAIRAGLDAVRELHDRSGKWLTMSSNTRARNLSSEARSLNMQAKSLQR
jgi:Apea-like HEPN